MASYSQSPNNNNGDFIKSFILLCITIYLLYTLPRIIDFILKYIYSR